MIILIILLIILFALLCDSMFSNFEYEHLTQISNESVQNLASLYNSSKIRTSSLDVTGPTVLSGNVTSEMPLIAKSDVTINGSLNSNGKLNSNKDLSINGKGILYARTITARPETGDPADGILNISGASRLNLLTYDVAISKGWGGSGNLVVQGTMYNEGPILCNNSIPCAWIIKINLYENTDYSGNPISFDNIGGCCPTTNTHNKKILSCKIFTQGDREVGWK